jgi:hypothetical protein
LLYGPLLAGTCHAGLLQLTALLALKSFFEIVH